MTIEQLGKVFQNPSRNASSNYGIGKDGKIACFVNEEDRAWTSSSKSNDIQAITVEVSNDKVGGNWHVSDKSFNALVNLAYDVCKRHGFRLKYTGDKKGSLTTHRMFAPTACPGKYLNSKMKKLEKLVNAKLDADEKEKNKFKSYKVEVTANVLNIREKATTSSKVIGELKKGKIVTILAESKGWGKIRFTKDSKQKIGWIYLKYTKKK